jgi:uncharacterized protein
MLIQKKIIFKTIVVLVALYFFVGLLLYFFQEKFLFHPQKLNTNYTFNFKKPFAELIIPLSNTDTLSLVKFYTNAADKKGIVLYYHGNMKNVTHYEPYVNIFTKNGYDVWMPDYPSFGKSSGMLSEQKMYEQALLAKKLVLDSVKESSLIIYGKSLGTGIAAYVAQNTKAKYLILETPYSSIHNLYKHYAPIYPVKILANYEIPSCQFLKNVQSPITIFHGTKDDVIPLSNALQLKKSIKRTDQFKIIEGANHQNINKTQAYFYAIDSLLAN